MKYLLSLWVMICLLGTAQAQSIYLVRHAEKVDDGSKDPVLTAQGQVRANNIAAMLSAAEISQVFSTDYQRTQMTAKPLADLLSLSVTSYNPRKLAEFADNLKQIEGNAVVVGHSNTTPELAELLAGQTVKQLSESDYDDVYQIILNGESATVTMLKSLPLSVAATEQVLSHQ